jgi:hypothetical protein
VKPIFFVALLLKQLLGPVSLAASYSPSIVKDTSFASHVWCAGSHFGAVESGALALVFANSNASAVNITLSATDGGASIPLYPRTEFVFTAPGTQANVDGLLAERLLLNGVAVDGSNFTFPFVGRDASQSTLIVPGFSYGVVVLHAARSKTCAARATKRAAWAVKRCGPAAAQTAAAATQFSVGAVVGIALGGAVCLLLVAAASAGLARRFRRSADPSAKPLLR